MAPTSSLDNSVAFALDDSLLLKPRGGLRISTIMLLVIVAAIVLAIARFSWMLLAGLSIPFLGVLVVGAILIYARRESTQQEGLLAILAVAAHRGVPLGPALKAYGVLCGAGFKARVDVLASRLEAGELLPRALGELPKLVRPADLLLINMAWFQGKLTDTLQQICDQRTSFRGVTNALSIRIGYFFVLLFFIEQVGGFLSYFVRPKILVIVDDFGVVLPAATQTLLMFEQALLQSPLMVILPIVQMILFFFFITRLFGFWKWGFPVVDRFFLRPDTFRILRSLEIVISAGRPVTEGIDRLASIYPKKWVREQLVKVSDRVHEGVDWLDALRAQRLIRGNDHLLLESARTAGNLGWALRELTDRGERRMRAGIEAWGQVLSLLVLLMFGGFVFLVCLAYYSPIVSIIESLIEK